jgi:hypothetical protein
VEKDHLQNKYKGEKTMTYNENTSSLSKSLGVNMSHRRIALIAGFGLLMMTVTIILVQVVAMAGIIVEGDAAATVENILTNQSRFRFGIAGHLIVVILDLVVAWALFVFLKQAQDELSLLAAWSRVVYTIIYGIALVNLYSIFQLLGDGGYLTAFDGAQIKAQVMLAIKAFEDTWDVGYIFFGLHLTLLGVVAFRSGFIPKVIGVILVAAGVSYLVDYLALILFPQLGLGISFIFGWGELIFMLWLIIWGGKKELA